MIRRATAADAPAIAALWNPCIRDTLVTFNAAEKMPAEVAKMIGDRDALGHATLVAEGPDLLGFASYAQFRAGVGYARCMEHTIILAAHARGRGTGRALMAALEDHARTAGAHQMIAGVSAGNPAGRAFHERLGYRMIATLPEVGFKFGRFLDLWLMQKFL